MAETYKTLSGFVLNGNLRDRGWNSAIDLAKTIFADNINALFPEGEAKNIDQVNSTFRELLIKQKEKITTSFGPERTRQEGKNKGLEEIIKAFPGFVRKILY